MAKSVKKDFKSSLLNLENETLNKQVEVVKVEETRPTQEDKVEYKVEKTSENVVNDISNSLTVSVLEKVKVIEDMIDSENNKRSFKKGAAKIKYSDKYRPATLSLRPEIRELLDYLYESSSLNKAEILELVILNGLRNTNFDE
jgi:hypothetical protein